MNSKQFLGCFLLNGTTIFRFEFFVFGQNLNFKYALKRTRPKAKEPFKSKNKNLKTNKTTSPFVQETFLFFTGCWSKNHQQQQENKNERGRNGSMFNFIILSPTLTHRHSYTFIYFVIFYYMQWRACCKKKKFFLRANYMQHCRHTVAKNFELLILHTLSCLFQELF